MASLRKYCEKMSSDALEELLFGGMDAYPPEVVLTICHILLERQPDRLDILKIVWQITDALEE